MAFLFIIATEIIFSVSLEIVISIDLPLIRIHTVAVSVPFLALGGIEIAEILQRPRKRTGEATERTREYRLGIVWASLEHS